MTEIHPAEPAREEDRKAPISTPQDSYDEKIDIKEPTESVKSRNEIESDPFIPLPDDDSIPEETNSQILTIRAVVVGCVLGALVNASNVYLGKSRPADPDHVYVY